jgi:hypothetical protein
MHKAWLSAVSWDSMSLLPYKINTYLHANFYFEIFLNEEIRLFFSATPTTKYKKNGIYSGISGVPNCSIQKYLTFRTFKMYCSIILLKYTKISKIITIWMLSLFPLRLFPTYVNYWQDVSKYFIWNVITPTLVELTY